MNADEIKISSADLREYQAAAIIAAEIAILKAEIERAAATAAKRFAKIDFKGYKQQRDKAARKYQEMFVLQKKLQDEIKKVKEKEEK